MRVGGSERNLRVVSDGALAARERAAHRGDLHDQVEEGSQAGLESPAAAAKVA